VEVTRKAAEATEKAAKEVADIRAAATQKAKEAAERAKKDAADVRAISNARIAEAEAAAARENRRVRSEAQARCRRAERELEEERMARSNFEQMARSLQLESNEQKQLLKEREEELRGECLPKVAVPPFVCYLTVSAWCFCSRI
jgi:hypothetical protein